LLVLIVDKEQMDMLEDELGRERDTGDGVTAQGYTWV
jgi:hypothetical protein